MLAWLRAALQADGRPYRLVSGSWEERRRAAAAALAPLLAPSGP